MDKIEQKFGIDASQALAALDQLNTAYRTHAKALDAVAKTMGGTSKSVQSSAKAMASQTSTSMLSAARSTERFHTSLALLSRIAFTQVVIKGMRTLENATAGAAREFQSFEKGLSEIQAISPEDSIDDLAKSSKRLSNQWNVPLLEVVKSRYDLISNGFTKAADSAKIFEAAAKLSKVGVSTLPESIDLLSTSLNAYGSTAEDANRFARDFFEAVNIGKFRVDELSKAFGKVAPSAKNMGVSLEETLSFMTAFTVRGVSVHETATQINSILAAFIKPSKGMQQALQKLGVASGKELINQRGLAGAIKSVIATTNGSPEALGTLFNNVRALRGVMTATNDNFATLNDHLKKLTQFAQKDFDLRVFNRMSTDSERVAASVNKLSNALTSGLGGGITQTLANFDKLIGKTDIAASAVESFFRVITGHGINDLTDTNAGIRKMATTELLIGKNRAIQNQLQVLEQLKATQPNKQRDAIFGDALNLNRIEAFSAGIKSLLSSLDAEIANTDLDDPIRAAVEELKNFQTQTHITGAEFAVLKQKLGDIGGTGGNIGQSVLAMIKDRQEVFQKIAPENLLKLPPIAESLSKAAEQLAQGGLTTEQALSRASQQLLQASDGLAVRAQQAASSIAQAAAASAQAGAAAAQSKGGVMRLAGGGFAPRGTDTIPAMLSPGEFVVNARSTRRFFSQLQAINAGVAPVFRADGGSVDNSVGDINVNIHAASQPEATGRAVIDAIKRQYRRGAR